MLYLFFNYVLHNLIQFTSKHMPANSNAGLWNFDLSTVL